MTATCGAAQDALPSGRLLPEGETAVLALVIKAHPVVQGVMALLALASFAVLTVLLFKLGEFALMSARLSRSMRALSGGKAAQNLPLNPLCPLAQSTRAAAEEAATLAQPLSADLRASARERLDLTLARIEARALQRLRAGTGLLASIGAVGPFIGLFGTVFGIMNSFMAISASQTTNLAIVAPGIAEALLATALGLTAAIPAVLLYNHLMRRIAAFRHRLADGMAEVLRQFSHAADARMAGQG
jgi:biopolymer transport protein ExbB